MGAPLLLLLLLAEGVARLVVPEPAVYYQAHPYLRRVRAPGSDQTLTDPFDPERRFTLRVDSQGFRSPRGEVPATKPAGVYRIFFVGASTTENVVLPDSETFPWLVEQALEARLEGVDVEAGNTGLSGH